MSTESFFEALEARALLAATFTVTNLNDAGAGSLRQAIVDANLLAGADNVVFQGGLGGTIALAVTDMVITDDLTITGPGAESLTVSGVGGAERLLRINPDTTASVSGLTFANAFDTSGAIANLGTLTLTSTTISNNLGDIAGGIYNNGTLTLNGCTVSDNAAGDGAGILIVGGPVVINDCTFSGNVTGGDGGAISNAGVTTITNSTFTNNEARAGGAILSSTTLSMENCTFSENTSTTLGGGAVYNFGGTASFSGCTFSGNETTSGPAGAVYANGGTSTFTGCTLSDNSAVDIGAVMYGPAGTATFNECTITGNNGPALTSDGVLTLNGSSVTQNSGTGITGSGVFTLTNSVVSGNSDGALRVFGDATLTACTISDNTTTGAWSAIHSEGSLSMYNSTISGNTGAGDGGGLRNTATLTLSGCTISGNTARTGGGIYSSGIAVTLNNCTISGNTATDGGGGVVVELGVPATLNNCTVVDNRGGLGIGGLWNRGQMQIRSTIVADNVGGDIAEPLSPGSINNLVRESGTAGGLVNGQDGNIVGVDPKLRALANNGGPTKTHALRAGSPAINAGTNPEGFANDQRGEGFARARGGAPDIGALEFNAVPTIGSLSASDSTISRGDALTLTAGGVTDSDGAVARVDFYLDANANNVADAGELLGSDSNGANGFRHVLNSTLDLPAGSVRFLAIAVDADGASSTARSTAVTVANRRPTLADLDGSTTTFVQGDAFTLTASGAGDTDGDVVRVSFFADLDADGIADQGELLGTDKNAAGGFTLRLTSQQSLALKPGLVTFLAVAKDSDGAVSASRSSVATVLYSIIGGDGRLVVGTADGSDGSIVVTVNPNNHVIVFEQGGSALDLQQRTGAADAIGDAVAWVDPKDGLLYVAAPSVEGLLLFTRSGAGEWSVRNLSTEAAATASPTHGLTSLISIGGIVFIAGITGDGAIVGFQQTPGAAPAAFEFVDISAQLDEQGMETPRLEGLISYVPTWDAWHLAGIDEDGRIQSVWINLTVEGFTKWRVDDLTQVTGAPAIAGQLAVTLTSWGGINLTGLDEDGQLLTTWWVPEFGGDWLVNNLTEQFNGASLGAGKVSGFTTPWGGLNYVGLDEDGAVTVYWWAPGLSDWNVTPLLPESTPSERVPTGALTASSSNAGTLNVYGTSSEGDVLRMWWQPSGSPEWTAENLSEVAVRA